MFGSFRSYRIVGYSYYRSLRFILPLVMDVRRHQNSVPLGYGVVLAVADEGGRALQNENHMFPLVIMPSGLGVTYRSGLHRVVVQHYIVGCTVFAADQHVARLPVQLTVVSDHWRLAGALTSLVLGPSALSRDKGVNLDAVDVALAAGPSGAYTFLKLRITGSMCAPPVLGLCET